MLTSKGCRYSGELTSSVVERRWGCLRLAGGTLYLSIVRRTKGGWGGILKLGYLPPDTPLRQTATVVG
jgi:hypothetical protein